MSAEGATYLDSSAIVKLVVREAETAALTRHLRSRNTLVSSAIARTEVLRAVMAHGSEATSNAEAVIDRLELLRLDDTILRKAGELRPPGLRSLDAIHLASALAFEDSLTEMLCYNSRFAAAAETAGIAVAGPT